MASLHYFNDEDYERAMDATWSMSLVQLAQRGVPLADFEPEPSPGDTTPDGDLAA